MSRPTRQSPLRHLTLCALFAAVLCLLSPISLPIGAVPISLGLFGVLLAAVALPPAAAFASVGVFFALGVCGIPVFGGGMSGVMVLVGPTGGYLWAYLCSAPVVSLLCKRSASFWHSFVACLLGVILCYVCGTAQFIFVTSTPLLPSLSITVLPFLPLDILKAAFAAHLGIKLKAHIPF